MLTVGSAVATTPIPVASTATAALALTTTTRSSFLYFSGCDAIVDESAESATDRLGVARIAGNSQRVVLAGLISPAVANVVELEGPTGEPSMALSLVLHDGLLLFLAAQTCHLHAVHACWSRSRVVAFVALVVTVSLSLVADPLVSTLLLAGVLVTVVLAAASATARTRR